MTIAGLLCLLFLLAFPATGEIYVWRDPAGGRHFSDRPATVEDHRVPVFDSDGGAHAAPTIAPPAVRREQPPPPVGAGNYRINPTLAQKGGFLRLSGRIEGGPACSRLLLQFSCLSEEGRRARMSQVARNVGGFLSDRLEAQTRVAGGTDRTRWEVMTMTATCQDERSPLWGRGKK